MIRAVASRVGGGRTRSTVLFVVLMIVCAIFVGRQLLLQRRIVARQGMRWPAENGQEASYDRMSRRHFIVDAELAPPRDVRAVTQSGGDHA